MTNLEKIKEIIERSADSAGCVYDIDFNNIALAIQKECFMDEAEIFAFMKDHYWDTLEPNRNLIELHCKYIASALSHKIPKGEQEETTFPDKVFEPSIGGCKFKTVEPTFTLAQIEEAMMELKKEGTKFICDGYDKHIGRFEETTEETNYNQALSELLSRLKETK